MHARRWSTVVGMAVAVACLATIATPAASAAPRAKDARDLFAVSGALTPQIAHISPELRVAQVGYSISGTKVAYVMLPARTGSVSFSVAGPQLRLGEGAAHGDPFALGTQLGASDATPHAFGLYVTDALYREYGGSTAYTAFARQQLNYALGANPWGASFVVGAGSAYPYCTQSEIANLSGSLTGTGAIQLGATVDGPSSLDNFAGLGTVSGMRACGHGAYGPFNNATAGYVDNVVSWPSVEPSLDYSAISLLAFAFGAYGLG